MKLTNDHFKSAKPHLESLIDGGYKVLIYRKDFNSLTEFQKFLICKLVSLHLYSGQLDLVVPYPGTVELIANLDWDGAEEYRLPTINLIVFSNLKNCNISFKDKLEGIYGGLVMMLLGIAKK